MRPTSSHSNNKEDTSTFQLAWLLSTSALDTPGVAHTYQDLPNRLTRVEVRGRSIVQNHRWAYQSNCWSYAVSEASVGTFGADKENTSNHFHIFVGDLSNEVNDGVLPHALGSIWRH